MKIIGDNNLNNRILIKDNNEEINVSNNEIIKYNGIYYNDSNEIETKFIGIIECCKYRHDIGIIGIYIVPLFIFYNNEWFKIINYKPNIYDHISSFLKIHNIKDPKNTCIISCGSPTLLKDIHNACYKFKIELFNENF